MYVAEIPNRDSPPAFLLRESFRENGKVKNRTLANLSSWPRPRIDALRRLLRGELDDVAAFDPPMGPTFSVLHAPKQMPAETRVISGRGLNRPWNARLCLTLAGARPPGSRC